MSDDELDLTTATRDELIAEIIELREYRDEHPPVVTMRADDYYHMMDQAYRLRQLPETED